MRKSKTRYFCHIFVSPGDTPEAITLNVVWMECEFDAYKLSRCTCPSNYNRFWDRARYLWKKSSFCHTLLAFDAPVRRVPVGIVAPPLGTSWLGAELTSLHCIHNFNGTLLFDVGLQYLRNSTRQRHSYNAIRTYACPTQRCKFEWPWVTLIHSFQRNAASRGLSATA